MSKPKAFIDCTALEEDKRIHLIGQALMRTGMVAGITIDDEPEKVARYIKKLTDWFPLIEVLDTKPLMAGSVVVRARRKADA